MWYDLATFECATHDCIELYTSSSVIVPFFTIDALKRHQRNNSRWFLKLDFSNFFGSTTHEFVLRQLSSIFPYSEIVKSERGREALSKALSLCFLNGVLPQGTPFSPTITNIMMIPIDHAIAKMCREHNRTKNQ